MTFCRKDFGEDFEWGAASSAYQVEGAFEEDGKGKSIWDVFSNSKGRIFNNQNGNVACDFYYQYENDLSLIQRLSIPNFRFSLSWSRIMPGGMGQVNQKGIDFYNRLIDGCLSRGIQPWVTLYHWDLPQDLEKLGGWTNRSIIEWFSRYAEICIKAYGDRVNRWMILNEPMAFTGGGYYLGVHAPGRSGLRNFLPSIHHAAICQAEGGRIIRDHAPGALVGTTFSCSLVQPGSDSLKDHLAAQRVDALMNRVFIEPLAGKGYPVADLKFLRRLEPYIKNGDESKLNFNMDFIGIQNYTREIIKHSCFKPLIWARVISAKRRNADITAMNWEVCPESLYHMLVKFSKYSCFKEIIVTESGAAFDDQVIDGSVHDEKRRIYHENYIGQVLRARTEGVNVNGYFAWSLSDNFEWAEGFRPRFGLVHIDFETQQRIIKDSGLWYSNFLRDIQLYGKVNFDL